MANLSNIPGGNVPKMALYLCGSSENKLHLGIA